MSNDRSVCLICCKEYAQSGFYKHRNEIINSKFGFCKKCVVQNIEEDVDVMYSYLRTMNIPFVRDGWQNALDSKTETVGTYLKMANLKIYRDLKFEDGDKLDPAASLQYNMESNDDDEFALTDEVLNRWGRSLNEDDYVMLEEEFSRLGGHEADNLIEESTIKNIARTQWTANKALNEGDASTYEKMMRILSTQMKDADINLSQLKKKKEGTMESWSEWVAFVEKHEPVSEDEKEYEPKYLTEYINRWFVSQMKRVFGKVKDEDIKKMDGEEL